MHQGHLIEGQLRWWLKEAWMLTWAFVVRVPYLSNHGGDVRFPPASDIENGDLLPARARAFILGLDGEEVPPNKYAFSTLKSSGKRLCLQPSQVPYEDSLLSAGPWLTQTTVVYFAPDFKHGGFEFIARSLFSAWRQVDVARGETPNLQQMRYFVTPVVRVGELRRNPIAYTVATHNRICAALADAQDKPVSPKDSYSWVEHGAEFGVVYRSIIIIVDKQPNLRRAKDEAECRASVFEECSVLLVRTGDEEQLSAPIDVSELGAALLPTGRDELSPDDKQQVVRVRLRRPSASSWTSNAASGNGPRASRR